jgi:hypothetical protein
MYNRVALSTDEFCFVPVGTTRTQVMLLHQAFGFAIAKGTHGDSFRAARIRADIM